MMCHDKKIANRSHVQARVMHGDVKTELSKVSFATRVDIRGEQNYKTQGSIARFLFDSNEIRL